jgi:hypothetical protein
MGIKEQWAAAALETILLPSGFKVRGAMPAPTEIIRLKLVPWQLRQAVSSMGGRKMGDLDEQEHAQLVEARRYQAAAYVREMAPPGSDEFEPVQVSVDELGQMPPGDIEALDDFIMGSATAEMITARSMVALGMLDKESAERIEQEEAADTVDGWVEFREGSGGADAGQTGAEMGEGSRESVAVTSEATDRIPDQRCATPTARKGRRAGSKG